MTVSSGSFASATSPLAAMDTALQAAGLDLVDAGHNFTYLSNYATVANVYKSPAAENSGNQDWYLIVASFLFSSTRYLLLTVVEGYDPVTHEATRYVPTTPASTTPAGDYSVGATAVPLSAANLGWLQLSWVDTAGQAYTLNATMDRIILALGTTGSWIGIHYMGLFDRTYPTTLDPVNPLGWVNLAATASGPVTTGGMTRCPGATAAGANNFRCFISNNALSSRPFNPLVVDSILGRGFLSPVGVCDGRYNSTSSLRALLKDVRITQTVSNGATDTLNELAPDGSTRTYFPAGTTGIFVPNF